MFSNLNTRISATLVPENEEHWSDLAGSEFMSLLAATYLILFMVKTCCQDWGQQYLLKERGVAAYPASSYLVSMEVGGLVGSIIVGSLTDLMTRKGYYPGVEKSPRMIIIQLCVAGSVLFLNLFLFSIDHDTSKVEYSVPASIIELVWT